MAMLDTGFGNEVSIELGALIVAIASSTVLLAFFLLIGRNPVLSLFEVILSGVVMGTAYYLGLRKRS
ncbi:hypothetical protein HTZ84_19720 [Haloterrigena sp. SYSU A558-1]|uniref:Uncharacterized protein n=1 Tax=Haloterrigena gelatinilytica TaxID=2741724 RepID=A0ABX2LE21_9EURY|nr:hypothetical protein [Haloterrigena gelatinilytica]NUC74497.1 hypothetical protein [Haloterrigena gelatinilytica]